jgi:hypothetical protein
LTKEEKGELLNKLVGDGSSNQKIVPLHNQIVLLASQVERRDPPLFNAISGILFCELEKAFRIVGELPLLTRDLCTEEALKAILMSFLKRENLPLEDLPREYEYEEFYQPICKLREAFKKLSKEEQQLAEVHLIDGKKDSEFLLEAHKVSLQLLYRPKLYIFDPYTLGRIRRFFR